VILGFRHEKSRPGTGFKYKKVKKKESKKLSF
jgi:hypothetical protein